MDIKDVKKVTISGCGTEGSQISSMVAYKGFETTVWLRSEGSIDRAKPRLESVRKQILGELDAWKADRGEYCRGLSDEKDLTDEQIDQLRAQAEERLSHIRLTASAEEAFSDADVVIECIITRTLPRSARSTRRSRASCPRRRCSSLTRRPSCQAPLPMRPVALTAT